MEKNKWRKFYRKCSKEYDKVCKDGTTKIPKSALKECVQQEKELNDVLSKKKMIDYINYMQRRMEAHNNLSAQAVAPILAASLTSFFSALLEVAVDQTWKDQDSLFIIILPYATIVLVLALIILIAWILLNKNTAAFHKEFIEVLSEMIKEQQTTSTNQVCDVTEIEEETRSNIPD